MILQLIIVADDLTGALDAAAPFVGGRVVVARTVAGLQAAMATGADVVAVATGTRDLPPAQAQAVMATLAAGIAGLPPVPVFKKVDSRLKGHVAMELRAVAAMGGYAAAVLCPAIPDMGRHVTGGAVTGMGVTTPIPVAPVLAGCAPLPVTAPDACDTAALDRIVATAQGRMLAGARGLAAALARSMGLAGTGSGPEPGGDTILAIGSRDPVTLAQVRALGTRVARHAAPDGAFDPRTHAGGSALIRMTGQGSDAGAGLRFGRAIADLITRTRPARLFCCGGETADSILGAAGVHHVDLLGEPFAGVPLSRARLPWGPVDILTKSGGFGAPDLLVRLVEKIEPAQSAGYGRKHR